MKIGVSSYSLSRAITSGNLTWESAMEWTHEHGGEHFEIVPLTPDFGRDEALLTRIVNRSKALGLPISSYTIGANFLTDTEAAYEAEVERVKREVDVAVTLGVTRMRHDAGSRPIEQTGTAQFEDDLPRLVEACQRVADYAKPFGIVTSVENHGYHVQDSERVHRLVLAVGRENFGTTLDVGNFLCADEDPVAAVQRNIGIASMLHFKDFYRRPRHFTSAGGRWFPSRSGYKLRGAIVGCGDIDLTTVAAIVRNSTFSGFVSLEFEGAEDCLEGTEAGLQNLRELLKGR